MQPSLWSRLRQARVVRIALVYLGVSWFIIQVVNELRDALSLPAWTSPVAVILLAIGLIIILATAWVQSQPATATRQMAEEVPGAWEVGLVDLKESISKGEVPHLTWGRTLLGGAFAFLLLFGFAGLYVVIKDQGKSFSPREAAASAAPGIAVVPFTVNGPDLGVWREGMVDLLSTNLDGVGGLRSVDSRTVLARWRESVRGDQAPDLETTLNVAARAGAQYAVIGSAVALGKTVRLSATAYEVNGARNLGQAQAEGPADSVMALVDRLSVDIVRRILEKATVEPGWSTRIANLTTSSLPALKAYLEGEALYRRSDFANAIAAYQRAVAADSTFALAWARLASSYGWAENIGAASAVEAARRSVQYIDRLPAREAVLVRAQHAMELGSLAELPALKDAVQKYPDDPEAWYVLGDTYYHLGSIALVDEAEVERAFARAAELDPSMSSVNTHRIERALAGNDTAKARQLLESFGRIAPGPAHTRRQLAYELIAGDAAERARAQAALDTLARRDLTGMRPSLLGPLGLKAQEQVNRILVARPDATFLDAYVLTLNLLNRGRLKEAVQVSRTDRNANPNVQALVVYYAWLYGFKIREDELDRTLALQPADTSSFFRPLLAGVHAADRQRWNDYERALRMLQTGVQLSRTAGDSLLNDDAAHALEAYALWRRGQTNDAITRMSDVQSKARGLGAATVTNQLYRAWLAEMLVADQRPAEAVRYFASLWDVSYADYRLGELYEQLGDKEKATRAYADFLTAWQDADPELPQVARARQALERLGVNR